MTLRRTLLVPVVALVVLFASSARAQNVGQPRYLTQMQAELQAMGLAPQCSATSPQAGACTTRASSAPASTGGNAPATRRYVLKLQYDDNSDTIYAYVDHYGQIAADAPTAPAVFRRLLEMNWEMLIGRFEWSSTTGEIRLSAVINTDSNFDRRAFRAVVHSLLRLADRYADEVARITGHAVGEPAESSAAPPATPSPAPAH